MGQVLPFARPHTVFDPDEMATLTKAYDLAIAELHGETFTDFVREIVAKRIIAAAKSGQRDPERLYKSALSSIGFPE
jgi:hypothetical protein